MTAEFLRHEPCEVCGSSDAKAVYDDGNTFCFSCHNLTRADNTQHMPTNVQFKGSAQRLQKRKISEETCQHYKVYRDGDLLRFPYYSSDKTLQGFKTKNKLIQSIRILHNTSSQLVTKNKLLNFYLTKLLLQKNTLLRNHQLKVNLRVNRLQMKLKI